SDERLELEKKGLMMEALGYLFSAYSHKRRRLGPMAVLHPLRAAALLTRAREVPSLASLLTVLFHDILEDVQSVDFEAQEWQEMEQRLFEMLEHMSPEEESQLIQRLRCLTRTKTESYYRYIGRMLECAVAFPDVVEVKLADRLDNTLDMRIDLEDPLVGIDCFQNIFQLLFVNNYPGYEPRTEHQPSTVMNGARRLQQLYKNAVLLSLIRQLTFSAETPGRRTLFNAVAEASLKEAQRTIMHLLGYHCKDHRAQRQLILDAMEYCFSGRSDLVTKPDGQRMLDGLFSTYFAPTDGKLLRQQLDILYQNKPLMIQASIAFIVIFLGFLNDPRYYIRGISIEGIEAA
ncbi:MAG: hypothetical protein MUC33_22715, partial [Desulfobacterales bacterium]|nr:hypothetical protein [Desulfobacterales bacterium]